MVMGSRKAAPALRARPLRSYVPLRRVPSESVLSGTIPGLPGGSSLHPQIQISYIFFFQFVNKFLNCFFFLFKDICYLGYRFPFCKFFAYLFL